MWLVLLLLSMWRFRKFQVVSADTQADMAAVAAEVEDVTKTGSEDGAVASGHTQTRRGWLHLGGLGFRGKHSDPAAG